MSLALAKLSACSRCSGSLSRTQGFHLAKPAVQSLSLVPSPRPTGSVRKAGWAESAASFTRAWPGPERGRSFHLTRGRGPSPNLGGLSFYFKVRDA